MAKGRPPMDEIDSISEFESEFHHAFVKGRLAHDDFVFQASLLQELDEFCDVDSMHVPKGPLIVFGEPGSGKSAFLANWMNRRKKKFHNWNNGFPEFIFYHAVGCTRQGAFVSRLLERILTEMKEFFELAKDVPTLEERLSWQFPRYLDAASRKGRTILIVDGVHRLRTTDGDSILKWLPLSFPPNVRLILAATSPSSRHATVASDSDMLSTMERIKVEASRRNWTTVCIDPFTVEEARTVVHKFLARQVNGTPTLQLFDLQQKAIASVPRATNAMFLKTLLIGLEWMAGRGYNIHAILRDWLVVSSISSLYEAILRSMEAGYTTSVRDTQDSMLFLQEHSLDATFAWMPQMTTRPSSSSSTSTLPTHRTSTPDRRSPPLDTEPYNSDDEMRTPRVMEETDANIPLLFRELAADATPLGQDSLESGPRPIVLSVFTSSKPPALGQEDDSADTLGGAHSFQKKSPEGASSPPPLSDSPPRPSVVRPVERTKTMRTSSFPIYVTGGQNVLGLDGLLGKALCVLYVARHGLLLHELRTLMQAMTVDETRKKDMTAPEMDDDDDDNSSLNAILSDNGPSSRARAPAFSEETWTTLLSALRALGCLFLQDIVLLPHCNDALRELIWWRYIGSLKAEETYHHWLVRFFISHSATFRRVEELPWHLASCKRWLALKDILVNLQMFQLFFTATYKTELFSYWKMLTEGVYVSGSATPPPPPSSQCFTETQDNGGIVEPPAITTFDLVREYNKSIEEWYHTARPATKQLLPMLQTMTKFIFEYSVFSQSELPRFNHPALDLKALASSGFRFVDQMPHAIAQQALDPSLHWLYHRWVWVQFPWLALGHEIEDPKLAVSLISSSSSTSTQDVKATDQDPVEPGSPQPALTPGNSTPPPPNPANASLPSCQSMPNLTRKPPGPTISPYKLKGITNASLPTIAVANAPNTLDIIGPNSPTHVLMRRKTNFVGYKNAPTACFPAQIKSPPRLDDASLNSGVGKLLSQGSSASVPSSEGFGLPAHMQEYSKTEADIKRSCNQQILLKLQQSHNFLRREAYAKSARLVKLRQKIRERKAKQTSSLQYIQEAEEALGEMTKRMDQVDATLKLVGKQEKTYSKLLTACDDYPAIDSHHLNRVKKELQFLTLKLRDLQKERAALAFEQHHLATTEFPQLRAACDENKRLHDAVLDRLERTKQRMAHDQANIEELYKVRQAIIDRVKSTAFDLKTNDTIELDKLMSVQATAETIAANKSQVAKTALEQCQSMCRRIIHATGLANMAAIHEKFSNREALNRSLDEQAALYEARLKQIKMSHSELESQMRALETVPKDTQDPRQLEDLARDAEASLSRVQQTYATQLHALNEVLVGISNVARLVGITDVRCPKRGLVPAAELWPPYQDKESRAMTLSHFETVSANTLIDVIRVCEERMVVIIDNNEHGRGDPDALYAQSRRISRRDSSVGLSSSPRIGPGKRRPKKDKRRNNLEPISPREREDLNVDMDSAYSTPSSTTSQLDSPREDDTSAVVLTRENIKVSSKHKVSVKKKELTSRPNYEDSINSM
ncbi:hypothetical protein LEN26_012444 [Aphanomyces euteiches]|nr:hypothetical protein LEN26_012444 [Aphanomyces euteiches]KAH9127652.1 hypothetical protein AeMF1_002072 [Aphanomyces euteiches]KAH9194861.1 hypothetical protein AeNC1_003164 [Aphanomyces euteiches]